jgi:hypothetical protein
MAIGLLWNSLMYSSCGTVVLFLDRCGLDDGYSITQLASDADPNDKVRKIKNSIYIYKHSISCQRLSITDQWGAVTWTAYSGKPRIFIHQEHSNLIEPNSHLNSPSYSAPSLYISIHNAETSELMLWNINRIVTHLVLVPLSIYALAYLWNLFITLAPYRLRLSQFLKCSSTKFRIPHESGLSLKPELILPY